MSTTLIYFSIFSYLIFLAMINSFQEDEDSEFWLRKSQRPVLCLFIRFLFPISGVVLVIYYCMRWFIKYFVPDVFHGVMNAFKLR